MKRNLVWVAMSTTLLLYACQHQAASHAQQKPPDSMTMIPTDTMIHVTDTTVVPTLVESWTSYESYNGKYAADIRLLQLRPLRIRLRELLKEEEEDFVQRYKVTPPIEIESGILFNEGCKPHSCTVDEAALAIDMKRDVIYVGIARDRNVKLYGERGDSAYPGKLLKWMEKFEGRN